MTARAIPRGLWVVVVLGLLLGVSGRAEAQDGARGRNEARAPDRPAPEEASAEVEATEVDEGEKVKVFKFTGLELSGQLKSPQLLYFLNRLRAEFDRPRLPHRSFMPELVRSSKDENL